ncbi:MAG: molybdopterin-binding protein [Quisquiliibacterium sp.]
MDLGLIIVGDEILSGKRSDKHFAKVVELLAARGRQLSWARYVGDDRQRLVATLSESFASGDTVFCCGGIGATPDDHTRQAAAQALGLQLALHPEAAELIRQRCVEMAAEGKGTTDMTTPENRQRLKMGEFPVGSQIIPNPFNKIPGFAIRDHYFVPGFPVMAWPMIEALLDERLQHLHGREAHGERSLLLYEVPESAATPLMEAIEAQYPGVRVFSLPSVGEGGQRRHIELGVKGPVALLEPAWTTLQEGAGALGGHVELMSGAGANSAPQGR